MRVLVIKTSSMGDVIHTLPALTDAARAIPGIIFDWVVEENFAEIPAWHPHVKRIIPVALRRWRKSLFSKKTREEWRACRQLLRSESYDLIIDAQGLVKSAWLGFVAKGVRAGFDWRSAREPWASLCYQKKYFAGKIKKVHAVDRMRRLFSQALGYSSIDAIPDYGVDRKQFQNKNSLEKYLVFLHGTTWPTKHWPETYWLQLAKIAEQQGWRVKLLWGNKVEHDRASRIAAECAAVDVMPRMSLREIANLLAGATAVAAVDTGLCHLSAALDVPTVSLYGPTDPRLTGAVGRSQVHLSAPFPCAPCFSKECTYQGVSSLKPPCFEMLPPSVVWNALSAFL